MKPVPTIDLIDCFFQLVNGGPEKTCGVCLANLGKYLYLGHNVAELGIELGDFSSQERELRDMGKMMEKLEKEIGIATDVEVGK